MDIQQQARCTAHEIRNHVSICELYTEIIRKNIEKEGIKNESIENAINCIKRSLKIISNNLLDLKSLDNLNLETYDIKDILETAVELSKVYASDKKIDFVTNIQETASVTIDENKFLACVVNIIKNGIEAIADTGIIKVSLKIADKKANIQISNNGKPINKEHLQKVFAQGFTTKQTGSGLGLFICKNTLESQNAVLELLKSDKKETVFEITLPALN